MNGMDAVIQIRNSAVKGFSIYADKTRGCAARLPLRASPDAFHSALKIRKREVVPVNEGFLCGANPCCESIRDGLQCGCSAWMPGSSAGMTNENVKATYNALLLSFTTAA